MNDNTLKWLPMKLAPKGHPYQACFILCYVEQDGGGFYIVMFYNHELAGWQSSVDCSVHTPLFWMPIIKIDGHEMGLVRDYDHLKELVERL
jgi:hypothetical protein